MITVRYFILTYKPLYSGAANSLEKLINKINPDKFNIEIVTTHIKGQKRFEIINNVKIFRIGYGLFGYDGLLNFWGKFFFLLHSSLFSLTRFNYNILHVISSSKLSLPTLLLAQLQKKNIVNKITRVGEDDPLTLIKSFWGKIIVKILSKNTVHIIISKQILNICNEFNLWNTKSLKFLPNPVDIDYYSWEELSNNTPFNKNTIDFLYVGVLAKHKGIDVLINLWNEYNINANLLICGVPLYPNDSNVIIKSINSNPRIKWLGRLDKKELKNQYLACDAFLFPSLVEGLPNALLEAMSYGKICIANLIVGVTDYLLENNRGIIITQNDKSIWKIEIEKLIASSEYRETQRLTLGYNAYAWVTQNAESGLIAKKIEAIYDDLESNK